MNAAGSTTHHEFFGKKATREECLHTCIGKIQVFPNINGVQFKTSSGDCFCKIKMVNIIANAALESCKLISK